jgi:uncharacterized protein YegP (UPF0339 family)
MAGTFELKKTGPGKYHFVLKAGNGEDIATSEGYTSKSSAQERHRLCGDKRAIGVVDLTGQRSRPDAGSRPDPTMVLVGCLRLPASRLPAHVGAAPPL